jgi:hypothetical protein
VLLGPGPPPPGGGGPKPPLPPPGYPPPRRRQPAPAPLPPDSSPEWSWPGSSGSSPPGGPPLRAPPPPRPPPGGAVEAEGARGPRARCCASSGDIWLPGRPPIAAAPPLGAAVGCAGARCCCEAACCGAPAGACCVCWCCISVAMWAVRVLTWRDVSSTSASTRASRAWSPRRVSAAKSSCCSCRCRRHLHLGLWPRPARPNLLPLPPAPSRAPDISLHCCTTNQSCVPPLAPLLSRPAGPKTRPALFSPLRWCLPPSRFRVMWASPKTTSHGYTSKPGVVGSKHPCEVFALLAWGRFQTCNILSYPILSSLPYHCPAGHPHAPQDLLCCRRAASGALVAKLTRTGAVLPAVSGQQVWEGGACLLPATPGLFTPP